MLYDPLGRPCDRETIEQAARAQVALETLHLLCHANGQPFGELPQEEQVATARRYAMATFATYQAATPDHPMNLAMTTEQDDNEQTRIWDRISDLISDFLCDLRHLLDLYGLTVDDVKFPPYADADRETSRYHTLAGIAVRCAEVYAIGAGLNFGLIDAIAADNADTEARAAAVRIVDAQAISATADWLARATGDDVGRALQALASGE